jgi:hypothetical protein
MALLAAQTLAEKCGRKDAASTIMLAVNAASMASRFTKSSSAFNDALFDANEIRPLNVLLSDHPSNIRLIQKVRCVVPESLPPSTRLVAVASVQLLNYIFATGLHV